MGSLGDQVLHGLHFMLCAFAVLIASVSLATEKGSLEHKFAGYLYLPLSLISLLLASLIAWHEKSSILFCFNVFCVYLLMSGWRAVHEDSKPDKLDWSIPLSLLALALGVMIKVLLDVKNPSDLYLTFFSLNSFYLVARDFSHLKKRSQRARQRKLFGMFDAMMGSSEGWLGRHVAGMVGSATANLSVVILTLLPLRFHWLWPVTLLIMALVAARFQNEKRRQKSILRQFGLDASGLKNLSR